MNGPTTRAIRCLGFVLALAIGLAAPPARSQAAGPVTPLPFASTTELRAATVAREVRAQRATNPIGGAETAREMARHDYDTIFRGFLDGTPLRPDDAGDVLAAFVALQWMVANDSMTEPSPSALRPTASALSAADFLTKRVALRDELRMP